MTTSSLVLSVSQLNHQVKQWLEHDIGMVFVEGELSNISKPSSGHYYFTLKDNQAQIRCAYFRNRQSIATDVIQNGQHVLVHGRLSLYEARGDYQLIVEELSDFGLGDLYRQFECLKNKLKTEGLFDRDKKPLPRFPDCIAVITSATGAALHDILTTLKRRYPLAMVRIYASEVQGQSAHIQLIAAILRANEEALADVIILARGGGSIEDLWAFNEETLARTMTKSHIPIVTGIGHETDFTIADFVADLRAATPTAAAEAVTPNIQHLLQQLTHFERQFKTAIQQCLQRHKLCLTHLLQKLTSKHHSMKTQWQTLDYLEQRLFAAINQYCHNQQQALQLLLTQINAKHPGVLVHNALFKIETLTTRLHTLIKNNIAASTHRLSQQMAALHVVSPLATLERGYSITTHQHHVLLSSQMIAIHDMIEVQLANGRLTCEVIDKE